MKKAIRASRKGGKKPAFKQSPKNPESDTGKNPRETTISLETRAGEPVEMKVSTEMAERMKAETAIKAGPFAETDRHSHKGKIELGAGIYDAIFRHSQSRGTQNFPDAFDEIVRGGLVRVSRRDAVLTELDNAEQTILELKLFFHTLQATLLIWQRDGVPTKELVWDLNAGFLSLTTRLGNSLIENIEAVRKAI